jgi:hypothetical protein
MTCRFALVGGEKPDNSRHFILIVTEAFPKLQFLEDKRNLSSDRKFRGFARRKA